MEDRKNSEWATGQKNVQDDQWWRNKPEKIRIYRKTAKESERYEHCVRCHKQLNIPVEMEIDIRPFYIEGAGQLCYDCYQEIYR